MPDTIARLLKESSNSLIFVMNFGNEMEKNVSWIEAWLYLRETRN